MFYMLPEKKKFEPYILAGHCFDYTRVTIFNTTIEDRSDETTKRWSSAAQAGLGAHYHFSDKFNLSFSAQYMVHLGNDIHTHLENNNGIEYLEIEQHESNNKLTFEGHLLMTLSLNIKIADLW
jgi:outer membrane protein W